MLVLSSQHLTSFFLSNQREFIDLRLLLRIIASLVKASLFNSFLADSVGYLPLIASLWRFLLAFTSLLTFFMAVTSVQL